MKASLSNATLLAARSGIAANTDWLTNFKDPLTSREVYLLSTSAEVYHTFCQQIDAVREERIFHAKLTLSVETEVTTDDNGEWVINEQEVTVFEHNMEMGPEHETYIKDVFIRASCPNPANVEITMRRLLHSRKG